MEEFATKCTGSRRQRCHKVKIKTLWSRLCFIWLFLRLAWSKTSFSWLSGKRSFLIWSLGGQSATCWILGRKPKVIFCCEDKSIFSKRSNTDKNWQNALLSSQDFFCPYIREKKNGKYYGAASFSYMRIDWNLPPEEASCCFISYRHNAWKHKGFNNDTFSTLGHFCYEYSEIHKVLRTFFF